jgi:FtsZ-interacting cell division protein YlmF
MESKREILNVTFLENFPKFRNIAGYIKKSIYYVPNQKNQHQEKYGKIMVKKKKSFEEAKTSIWYLRERTTYLNKIS